MSGYLELARRIRASQEEFKPLLDGEAVADLQTFQQNRSVPLDSEGRKLTAAGFKPKERGGKIIW